MRTLSAIGAALTTTCVILQLVVWSWGASIIKFEASFGTGTPVTWEKVESTLGLFYDKSAPEFGNDEWAADFMWDTADNRGPCKEYQSMAKTMQAFSVMSMVTTCFMLGVYICGACSSSGYINAVQGKRFLDIGNCTAVILYLILISVFCAWYWTNHSCGYNSDNSIHYEYKISKPEGWCNSGRVLLPSGTTANGCRTKLQVAFPVWIVCFALHLILMIIGCVAPNQHFSDGDAEEVPASAPNSDPAPDAHDDVPPKQ